MDQENIIALIKACTTERLWVQTLKSIRDANDGEYPDFWFELVVKSGLIDQILSKWEDETYITFKARPPMAPKGPSVRQEGQQYVKKNKMKSQRHFPKSNSK